MSSPQLNIVYIHSHDSGRYASPYGYAMPTPNIQRLAEQGVIFRNAFCAAPSCSPSRAALLTGMYPHSNGMNGLAHRGAFGLNDYSQHLLHTLRDHGYLTVLGGLQHIAENTDVIGFDRVLGPAQHSQACVANVIPRVEQFLDGKPTEPFFLDAGFFETHKIGPNGRCYPSSGAADENVDPRYVQPPACLPDTPETRLDMARYQTDVAVFDRGVGAILDALERNGLVDNTLVLLTTDHGLPMPRMKRTLSDGGIGVMMIMRGPGSFAGGCVIDGLVSHVDVFPTLCDFLDIPRPGWLQGVSFLPLVEGRAGQTREYVFAELTYHCDYVPKRGVRSERYKYVRLYDPDSPQQDSDGGPAYDLWSAQGWPECVNEPEQLYDLLFDPSEGNNLISHPDYQDIAATLRAALDAHLEQTDDPIVNAPIPPTKLENLGYVPDSIRRQFS